MDRFLDIRECFFIDDLIELLEICHDRTSCLDIGKSFESSRIDTLISDIDSGKSWDGSSIGVFWSFIRSIELGECCRYVTEEIFAPSFVHEILTIGCGKDIFMKTHHIDTCTFIVSIIVVDSWWYSRRSKFTWFRIEIMCLIEKCSYFRYVDAILPCYADTWVDHSMPDIDITGLGSIFWEDICFLHGIIDESLLIEVDIGIEAWEWGPLFFHHRDRYIPDQDGPDESRYPSLIISFIVELLIVRCDHFWSSITRRDEEWDSSRLQVSLDITCISSDLRPQSIIGILIDDDRDDITIVSYARLCLIK